MDVHIMHMMHILTECSTNKSYKRSSVDKERRSIPDGVMSDLCDSAWSNSSGHWCCRMPYTYTWCRACCLS